MQNRIDRLEGLVLSLMTNGSRSAGPAAALAAISGEGSAGGSTGVSNGIEVDEHGEAAPEESDTEQVTKSFGVMKMDNNKSYYISEAHWASVLNDVSLGRLASEDMQLTMRTDRGGAKLLLHT